MRPGLVTVVRALKAMSGPFVVSSGSWEDGRRSPAQGGGSGQLPRVTVPTITAPGPRLLRATLPAPAADSIASVDVSGCPLSVFANGSWFSPTNVQAGTQAPLTMAWPLHRTKVPWSWT